MEIPRWRILAGAEFRTATFRPRFLALQPHLPYRVLAIFMTPHGRAHSSGQYSGEPHWSDCQQAIWNTVQTCPEPVRLERVCHPICLAHMLPQWSPAFGFCQQHQEFPGGHPSKYYPGPILLNFSVQMGTGVSNMAQATDKSNMA